MLACFALARGATRQEAICGANRCAARAARAAMRYRTAVGRVQRACCDLCEYMQTMRRVYLSVVPVWYVPLLLDIMLRVFPISSSVSCDMSRRELRADLRFDLCFSSTCISHKPRGFERIPVTKGNQSFQLSSLIADRSAVFPRIFF